MSWSNRLTMQFLKSYKYHPALWDPAHEDYNDRNVMADAWNEISKDLNMKFTLDQLRKKKQSLMVTYKHNVNCETQSKWFAFKFMHSFLDVALNAEDNFMTNDEDISSEERYEQTVDLSAEIVDLVAENQFDENEEHDMDTAEQNKPAQLIDPTQNNTTKDSEEASDECTKYCQLLAHKLCPLSTKTRKILMNRIDNLVFATQMEDYNQPSTSKSGK